MILKVNYQLNVNFVEVTLISIFIKHRHLLETNKIKIFRIFIG